VNNFYIDINFTGAQKGMLFLNGGTVEARTDNANFLGTTETLVGNTNDKWLTNIFVHVREGGAIFDTVGKNISIKQPLYTGAPADGGLRKRGAGTLTLLNTNTYNGVTAVEGGTLKFGRSDLLPAASTALAASNAVLDVNGKTQTLAGLGGGGTVTNLAELTVTDTLAPGDAGACGTLTLAGAPASLAGCTLSVSVSADGACDRLHVQGDLDLSTLSLSVADTAQLNPFKRYTIASCTGTLGVPFGAVGTLPQRWLLKYDASGKSAYLVYDFGTLILVR
jgi:autotransporter-associated beta strand protein